MTKRELDALRLRFDQDLWEVWEYWIRYEPPADMSPFWDMEDIPELDDDANFNHIVGWLLGVNAATGWSLDRPKRRPVRRAGPKEWQPPFGR